MSSSFFSDEVPAITELRWAELYGEGVGRGAADGDTFGLAGKFGALAPRLWLGRRARGEEFRGGVSGVGWREGLSLTLVVLPPPLLLLGRFVV